MAYEDRKPLIKKIEELRGGRTTVCLLHFDRQSVPPIPGLTTQFNSDVKEALFRVLKESTKRAETKLDLLIYSRGGDTNAVWPLVSILREFDPKFELLVPFRCHSSGTLLAMGGSCIHMGPLSELSPIDPTTGNAFNPPDPNNSHARLGISVEDVRAYRDFLRDQLCKDIDDAATGAKLIAPLVEKLIEQVHPLALGNVHRVHQQIKELGGKLLELNPVEGEDREEMVRSLASRFNSHVHMINRHEAQEILGKERLAFASEELADAMDALHGQYKKDFNLWKPFFIGEEMGTGTTKDCRFVGGIVESASWSYLYETRARIGQRSVIPPNVQVQIPAGQPMPLVPGLPRNFDVEILSQGWVRNEAPKGVTT